MIPPVPVAFNVESNSQTNHAKLFHFNFPEVCVNGYPLDPAGPNLSIGSLDSTFISLDKPGEGYPFGRSDLDIRSMR